MTRMILADLIASISEMKKHPMQVIHQAKGKPVAILNRNQPVFYCISPALFEKMMDLLDDEEIKEIIASRAYEKEIDVSIDVL